MKKKLVLLTTLAIVGFSACKKSAVLSEETLKIEKKMNTAIALSATQTNVFDVVEKINASNERDRLKNGYYLTDFTATGLYMAGGDTLNITVQQTTGTRLPKLLIGTYSRYGTWNTQPTVVQLTAGTNTITNAVGGLLWIRYTNSTNGSTAKVTFNSGYQYAPYFKLGVTTNSDWINQLQTYTTPDVVLEGSNCFIVVSRTKAIQYQTEDQSAILNKITQVIALEDDLNGLDNSLPVHAKNVHTYLLAQHEDPAYYFFAYDYRTAYITSDVNAILTLGGVGTNGWGLWHELGHQHQMMWRWGTLGEVTVNLYSLHVQRTLTPSINRLVNDGVWTKAFTYLGKTAGTKDYNGSTSYANPLTDLFVRLCMFQQLTLAYGDNFYRTLAKDMRVENPTFANDDAKMRWFMLKACNISGKNLSNFFQKWGLNLSTAAATAQIYSDMAALGLSAPTTDPSTLQDNVTPIAELSKTGWSINSFSSEETSGEGATNGRAVRLIDGSESTYWHSRWTTTATSYPHQIVIDLGSSKSAKGLSLVQRSGLSRAIKDFQVLTSTDNVNFTAVNNYVAQNAAGVQHFAFGSTKTLRYLKVIANSAQDGLQFASLAELGLYN
ncbi:M60 family metallopeptidase [Pedobacter rhizosphaerae]|uniref:F5/8 type C domain-containing protein n=1 Tax=Pedobacter rhizosphaerae TaxID=390241 RepID=A0A1H9JXD5_9SPHI|nr:M60 family metallopeptidase [Pedobacter rhizosphaerae]SEQ91519.1 F5/8 type C domain-containing protein [Pedobacter rhizosphaerae]